MPSPPPTDDALLARLNALKKSSVTPSKSSSDSTTLPPQIRPSPSASPGPEDLLARFARLGSASPSGSPKPSATQRHAAPVIAPGAPSYLEGIAEGIGGGERHGDVEEEKSLEELIGEVRLEAREEWDIKKDEQRDLGKLIGDLRRMLPEVRTDQVERKDKGGKQDEGLTDWENVEVDIGKEGVNVGREKREDDTDHDDHDKEEKSEEAEEEEAKRKTEDEEADDIIARIMAELELSKKHDPPSPPSPPSPQEPDGDNAEPTQDPNKNKNNNLPDLSLPSVPASDLAKAQAFDDALTARMAALSAPSSSLSFPSAPSFSPAKKPPKVTSDLAGAADDDDDVDNWCVICNDDATLQCNGCDGDRYCQNCWMEGHRGESAGWDERRHKAVLFVRGKKKKRVGMGA